MIVCGVFVFGMGTQTGRLFVRELTSKFEIVLLDFLRLTFGAFNDVVCCYTAR